MPNQLLQYICVTGPVAVAGGGASVANINPDPHRHGYVFVPLNRMTVIFASDAAARAAVDELRSMHIEGPAIDVFIGEEGAEALDLSALGQSSLVRTIRNIESLTVQIADRSKDRADAALRAGGIVLAILLDGHEDEKDAVAALLRRHGGVAVRYWGRWTIEAFD